MSEVAQIKFFLVLCITVLSFHAICIGMVIEWAFKPIQRFQDWLTRRTIKALERK